MFDIYVNLSDDMSIKTKCYWHLRHGLVKWFSVEAKEEVSHLTIISMEKKIKNDSRIIKVDAVLYF